MDGRPAPTKTLRSGCVLGHALSPAARKVVDGDRPTPAVIPAAPGPARPDGPDENRPAEGLTPVKRAYNEPAQK
jgi:hypothetical protein